MKQGLDLDRVVLLGRTLDEYVRCFALDLHALVGKSVLDVAAGVSSFCAEANQRGVNVSAFDLIYDLPSQEISRRCEEDLNFIYHAIGDIKVYRWSFYQNPEVMRRFRERAYRTFLADYETGKGNRYCAGRMPSLPFGNGQFDLTLVSYLLFVYQENFDYEFHQRSLIEIMRVTSGEARIYPLVTFEAVRSEYLDRLKTDPNLAHLKFEEVATDFEFLANSNSFLRIRHRKPIRDQSDRS